MPMPVSGMPPTGTAYQSNYSASRNVPVALVNANVYNGRGSELHQGVVLMKDGVVERIGAGITPGPEYHVVDVKGRWVTPGLIDIHSHIGVYATLGLKSLYQGSETTRPSNAGLRVEDSVWVGDPGFPAALAAGVTTQQLLPGSETMFGGRGVTVKTVPGQSIYDMKFPGARLSLKMACGENPAVYRDRSGGPMTRMGLIEAQRQQWIEASAYRDRWRQYEADRQAGKPAAAPARDLALEALADVLDGKARLQNHCYLASEMIGMIEMAREFGFEVPVFHHGLEGYKISERLAQSGTCVGTWADWWGYKFEAYDGIDENAAMMHSDGVCVVIISDSHYGVMRLNQEVAKAWADGRRAGLQISEAEAISWITYNAAKALGIAERTGSIEPGKMADVLVWSAHPFSSYAHVDQAYVDGALLHDRGHPEMNWRSDFEYGTVRDVQ